MNRAFGLIFGVPIFFIATLTLLIVQQVNQENRQFDEYVLTYALDYATEGATQELLEMSRLDSDYQAWGRFNTDPEVARNMFFTLLALNYDLPLTEKSYATLEAGYVPMMCIATFDGYYMYTPSMDSYTKDKEVAGTYRGQYLQSSPKMPYTISKGNAQYVLNLGMENVRKVDSNGDTTFMTIQAAGISKIDIQQQVSAVLSDAMTYEFQHRTDYRKGYALDQQVRDDRIIYIPTELSTMRVVNPVTGPTVFAYVDNWDFGVGTKEVSSFSIGGARVQPARMVAGYSRGGLKLYAYADLIPRSDVTVIELFTSVQEAARNGYYYDAQYMG